MAKKTNNKTNPRITEIRVDFGKPATISGMNLDKNGELVFYDENGHKIDPISIETGVLYQRNNKVPKVINRSIAQNDKIQTNIHNKLKSYDFLFGIDTNSKDFFFWKNFCLRLN